MSELLRTDIADQVRSAICMPVQVAVKTCDAPAGELGTAVFSLIELLLRKRRDKQSETLELLGVQDSVKQFIIIHHGDDLSLRYIAKVRPGCQIDGRGKLGQYWSPIPDLTPDPRQSSAS